MGRPRKITTEEAESILKMKSQGMGVAQIAEKMKRTRVTVVRVLMHPEQYLPKKTREPTLTPLDVRALLRAASNKSLTADEIMAESGIATSGAAVKLLLKLQRIVRNRKDSEDEKVQCSQEQSQPKKLKNRWINSWKHDNAKQTPMETSSELANAA